MFYVIYNSATDQYRNDAGEFGAFADAEPFDCAGDAEYELDTTNTAIKVVGPCRAGREP